MMYIETEPKPFKTDKNLHSTSISAENRIEALRCLATLLLREVESLTVAPNFGTNSVLSRNDGQINLSEELEHFEIEMIRTSLIRAKGNQTVAASILSTKLTTLHAKIRRYGLERYIDIGRLEGVGAAEEEFSDE